MRLSPHVESALRRAYGVAVRDLDDAHRDLTASEERLQANQERVARHEAQVTELREAIEAHVRAEAEESAVEAAEVRQLDRERARTGLPSVAELRQLDQERAREPRIAGVLVGPGVDPAEAREIADRMNARNGHAPIGPPPGPADTRRARESWEH